MDTGTFTNPFRPGAGHMPPYLAGRGAEIAEFQRLLRQDTILENMVLTGLRGVGKTVLLDTLRPLAVSGGWGWVGADLSESTSITEERMALRLMTDLAVITSSIVVEEHESAGMGFGGKPKHEALRLDFDVMAQAFRATPGLVSDKLKAVLELVWQHWPRDRQRGIVFAYDEAQTISDHPSKDEYPLSLLLDVFQSVQKKGIPFMLVLAGLPTLFPKLVEARTFAERMFRVVFLDRLSDSDSRDAILKPIEVAQCSVSLGDEEVDKIVEETGGYPYFIQFICREILDMLLQRFGSHIACVKEAVLPNVFDSIIRKLDTDCFAGRWARATDRQRELLTTIAHLPTSESEFTVQEVVEKSKDVLEKPFGPSQVSQMLAALGNAGLIYKNRHGKYSFAVPLLGRFILRQEPWIGL
jgi:hypothetical protein